MRCDCTFELISGRPFQEDHCHTCGIILSESSSSTIDGGEKSRQSPLRGTSAKGSLWAAATSLWRSDARKLHVLVEVRGVLLGKVRVAFHLCEAMAHRESRARGPVLEAG